MYMKSDLWGLGVGGMQGYNPRTKKWELGYDADEDPLVPDYSAPFTVEDLRALVEHVGSDMKEINHPLALQFGETLDLFNNIYVQGKYGPKNSQQYTYIYQLQKLMEAIQMPIPNPKIKDEMDYIDLSLLDRTIIEPEYLISMVDGKRDKISFNLSAGADNKNILLTATFQDKTSADRTIEIQELEDAVSDIVHNNNTLRLENTEPMRSLMDDMVNAYCEASTDLFLYAGKTLSISGGLGVIIDTKVEQEVGTFEGITIQSSKDKNGVIGHFNDLMSILRPITDLTEDTFRYLYVYYDLSKNREIHVVAPPSITSQESSVADATLVMSSGFACSIMVGIPEDKSQLIRSEAPYLNAVVGQSPDNPAYVEEFDAYRESRSRIVHNSRASTTKKKMIQQFTDIEF